MRALEIFATDEGGRFRAALAVESKPSTIQGVFVFRERRSFTERIDQRVEEMFREGVVEEVARVGEVSTTAAKTLGLEQIRALARKEKSSSSECVASIQQATRRYAKRQLTWFRRQTNFEPLNLSLQGSR